MDAFGLASKHRVFDLLWNRSCKNLNFNDKNSLSRSQAELNKSWRFSTNHNKLNRFSYLYENHNESLKIMINRGESYYKLARMSINPEMPSKSFAWDTIHRTREVVFFPYRFHFVNFLLFLKKNFIFYSGIGGGATNRDKNTATQNWLHQK